MKKLLQKIDKIFHVSERGSTIGRELVAGVIVFLAMVYILPVNAGILGSIPDSNMTAIFIGTALCSAIASLVMGFVGNAPLVLCTSMSMNSYIAYTVCSASKLAFTWTEALTLTFTSGAIFFIITMTPLRQLIVNAIPNSLKGAITASLGAFIVMVGLKGCGVISAENGFPTLDTFTNPTVLLGLGAILLAFLLSQSKGMIGKLALPTTMGLTVVAGLMLGSVGVEGMPQFDSNYYNIAENFSAFFDNFGRCFNFAGALANVSAVAVVFSMVFVSLFDATSTLIAVGKDCGVLDANGQLLDGKKVMLADATGALLCGLFGTSTVAPLAESSVGIAAGARTGITSIVAGLLFALSSLFYPIFTVFAPINGLTPVTSFALVSVGVSMCKNLKNINWKDPIVVITSFVIIIMSILTYSISDGLGIGLIAYSLLMLVTGKGKKVSPVIYTIAGFFLIIFVLRAII